MHFRTMSFYIHVFSDACGTSQYYYHGCTWYDSTKNLCEQLLDHSVRKLLSVINDVDIHIVSSIP
jgi:hypothetical protein